MSDRGNDNVGIMILLGIIALSLIIIALNMPQFSVNIPPQTPSGDEAVQLGANRIAIVETSSRSGNYGTILVFDFDEKNETFNLAGKFDYSDYFRNPHNQSKIDKTMFEIPEDAEVQTMDMDEILMPLAMTLEEAQEEVTFGILVPSYLPDGYEFEDAMVLHGPSEIVSLTYISGNERLRIIETQKSPIVNSGEVVSINGVEGKLVTLFDDSKMLQWEIGNIHLTVKGSLDKEELIQIAESIQ